MSLARALLGRGALFLVRNYWIRGGFGEGCCGCGGLSAGTELPAWEPLARPGAGQHVGTAIATGGLNGCVQHTAAIASRVVDKVPLVVVVLVVELADGLCLTGTGHTQDRAATQLPGSKRCHWNRLRMLRQEAFASVLVSIRRCTGVDTGSAWAVFSRAAPQSRGRWRVAPAEVAPPGRFRLSV